MSFANSWGKVLPPTYRNVQAPVTDTSDVVEVDVGVTEAQPTETVAEEAYQAFVEEAEAQPKSKKKKKTEEVVEETSDETPVVED